MKPIVLSALALATLGASAQDLQTAITKGKVNVELRARYEYDEDYQNTPAKTATGLTLRTIVGYRTGDYYGVSANIQALDVSTIFDVDRFNDGFNNQTKSAKIGDPHQDRILEGYLEWKGLKAGRQTLSVDNQRFIGAGQWSQAPKSYTGVTLKNNFGLSWAELHAGYINDILLSDGTHRDAHLRFARIRFQPLKELAVTPFYYSADVKPYTTPTVPTSSTAATSSYQHHGLRADGSWNGLLYEVSFAKQMDYRNGTAAKVPVALYRMGMIGYKYKDASIKVVRESLEKGYTTPDASLHGFYGYADRISTTPSKGLVDTYVQADAKALGFALEVQYHWFNAQTDHSVNYGKELDLVLNYPVSKNLTFTGKYAAYLGEKDGADLTAYGASTDLQLDKSMRKFWLQATYKF